LTVATPLQSIDTMIEKIESMSVRELKQLITQAGLSTEDLVEKADLRARALSVLALNPAAAPPEVPGRAV